MDEKTAVPVTWHRCAYCNVVGSNLRLYIVHDNLRFCGEDHLMEYLKSQPQQDDTPTLRGGLPT